MNAWRRGWSVLIVGLIVGCSSLSWALTNEEVFSQFQFNFITPGARATALGGAFIGLADDATAVESNPAGLTKLGALEVSAEFKYFEYITNQFFDNEAISGEIRRKEFEDSVASLPFISVVYPYSGRDRTFVFSAYRQELINYKTSFRTGPDPLSVPGSEFAFFPVEASADLNVTNYGIGVAMEILQGTLSIAVSPRWSTMSLDSRSTRFDGDLTNEFTDPTSFSTDEIVNETCIDDEDNGFSVNAGVMWEPDSRISLGLVYRGGIEFNVTERPGREGFAVLDPTAAGDYDSDLAEFTLNIPDTFGAGVAFRAVDTDRHSLLFTMDVIHIRYEDLLEDFDILLGETYLDEDDYTVENVTEMHVGMEYEFKYPEQAPLRSLFLRAGIYSEPDHTIRYTADDIDEKQRFPGGEEQIHYTGGVGLVINEHIQIDTAANIADNNTQFSVSAVYRFY
ncbi:hypothetical protein GF339_17795 [candidate division KSB3 bacterium]|uniref:Uncharacterized protein n=1 Tax=candidate division KSB3 bacterium TaxID=2044937 RepID=A0A9D5Q7M1_9BACT|nr:hypothetical protein [candidate division KSB3 bacterium]MBD3326442.1 hypothetical protein [candidate division KSB3 bacterium]